MIADLTNLSPYILQIVVGVVVLLGIIVGLIGGFIKGVANLICYVVFGVAIFFLVTPVTEYVTSLGFLEKIFSNNALDSALLNNIIGIAYKIITIVGLIILAWILTKIIRLIFRKGINRIVKKSKMASALNRILGAILCLVYCFVFITFGLTVIKSPLLFKGGQDLIDKSGYVSYVDEFTSFTREELLCKNGIVCTVEDVAAKVLGGKDMSAEQISKATETLGRLSEIIENPSAYVNQITNDKGAINYEGLSIVLNDMAVVSEFADKFGFGDKMNELASDNMDEIIDALSHQGFIDLPQKDYDNLMTIRQNLDLSLDQRNDLDKLIEEHIRIAE